MHHITLKSKSFEHRRFIFCLLVWKLSKSADEKSKYSMILSAGASFQLFLGGPFFFISNATGLLKNWKKQHFICSNLTLFIVPFFLSFFFFFFFSLFFFFLLSFFLFPFSLGRGGGRRPPQPPQMAPLLVRLLSLHTS